MSDAELMNATSKVSRSGFNSRKAKNISYIARWHRDALIQLSLRNDVRAIEAVASTHSTDITLKLLGDGIPMGVRLVERRSESGPSPYPQLIPFEISRGDVLVEPHCSNARMLWRSRAGEIFFADRIRILDVVMSHPQGVAIESLTQLMSRTSRDPIAAIASMVCNGELSLDIYRPIFPQSIVCAGIFART